MRRSRARMAALAAATGTASLVLAALAVRLSGAQLARPWAGYDSFLLYMHASTMLRFGWVTNNPSLGYPYSMDLAHFPMPEFRSWMLLKVITWFTDNPFVAVNVLFLLGFFLVGACSYLLLVRTIGIEWLAVLLAISAAILPWHFHRFSHVLLADYSPVPIFLLLAHLMWTGWWGGSRGRLVTALLAAAYVGLGGLYYSFFAVLCLVPVLVWRIATARPRQWWPDLSVVAAIPATLFASIWAFERTAVGPATVETFQRKPIDSLIMAGDLKSILAPWPWSPGHPYWEGSAYFGVLTSLGALVALGLLVVFAIPRIGGRSPATKELASEITPWFRLGLWVLLWCAPGAGFAFALTVSPVLRAWGRLTIVLAYIALVVLGIAARTLIRSHPRSHAVAFACVLTAVAWQVSLDHRGLLDPAGDAGDTDTAAQEYAGKLRSAVRPGCPILQVPIMENPEDYSLTKDFGMGAYDHMVIPLYAPEFLWSFGVVKGTAEWVQAERRYPDDAPLGVLLAHAREDGFCAVHADEAGLDGATLRELESELGPAMGQVDRWTLFPLEGSRQSGDEGSVDGP